MSETLGQPPTPPRTGDPVVDDYLMRVYVWLDKLWRKLGQDTGETELIAANISGVVASANLPIGTAVNVTNDAFAEAEDVDATNTTVHIHGGAALAFTTPWNAYRDGALAYKRDGVTPLSNLVAKNFAGKAYATTYYMGYDTETGVWTISESYSDITGENMIRFVVRTSDSQGVTGDGDSGGGGSASGGFGGYESRSRSSGRGVLL